MARSAAPRKATPSKTKGKSAKEAAPAKASPPPNAEEDRISRSGEFIGIILLALCILALAALISLQFGSGNAMGPFGRMIALGLYAVLGLGAYLIVIAVGFIALRTILSRGAFIHWRAWAGYTAATLCGAVLFHCLFPKYVVYGFTAGGKGGEVIAELMIALFSHAGTYLVTTVGMVLFLMLATEGSLVSGLAWLARRFRGISLAIGTVSRRTWSFLRAIFTWEVAPATTTSGGALALSPAPKSAADDAPRTEPPGDAATEAVPTEAAATHDTEPTPGPALPVTESPAAELSAALRGTPPERVEPPALPAESPRAAPQPNPMATGGPRIVEGAYRRRKARGDKIAGTLVDTPDLQLPDLSLLEAPSGELGEVDHETMRRLADRLQQALSNYRIQGEVTEIHPGPVVTLYEFRPAPGTKIAKIAQLDRDLAMTLEATRVRIVAPIPGKGTVGIEVPNRVRETVFLQEVLAHKRFAKSNSLLTLTLGKDISGRPTVCDLAKAPHLLVAGSTGSGKSVGINGMLMSLLYRTTPEQVRMILIDPKMLEFNIYEGIPHLLLPVVTDPKNANQALRWAVNEMERRYHLLAAAGVRNIKAYNEQLESEPPEPDPDNPDAPPPEPLPYIVIVIDEFADLMMVAPKEIETSVARIAQKARAAGIHLIVATQRPSKDVITGLIKANFPSRIAFRVSSKIDSRVILDRNGAEALLGMGDMLYVAAGGSPERMHGAFVSTAEIKRVVTFLKEQAKPDYNLDILKPEDEEEADAANDEEADVLYPEAIRLVATSRRASTSWVQRKLRIGYNRAARMLERMEVDGLIGPPTGNASAREVLMPPPAE